MNDVEMAKELTDMGFYVGLNEETESYNKSLLVEVATIEGYKWNAVNGVWE